MAFMAIDGLIVAETAFPETKVQRNSPGRIGLPMAPGWAVFPKPVPDRIFPKGSIRHGEMGLLRVAGTASL